MEENLAIYKKNYLCIYLWLQELHFQEFILKIQAQKYKNTRLFIEKWLTVVKYWKLWKYPNLVEWTMVKTYNGILSICKKNEEDIYERYGVIFQKMISKKTKCKKEHVVCFLLSNKEEEITICIYQLIWIKRNRKAKLVHMDAAWSRRNRGASGASLTMLFCIVLTFRWRIMFIYLKNLKR